MASRTIIEPLVPADWERIREIFLDGLATGLATFESDAPTWEQWDAAHHPFCRLVARRDEQVAGWAALAPVSPRRCYAGVAEASVYVGARFRSKGVGRALLTDLVTASEQGGIWTLQSATIAENVPSLRLQESCGFRVVGRRDRIAKLDGRWRDTVLMERRSSLVG